MKRPEQAIHQAVVVHLNHRAMPGVWFCHCPNEGKRGWVNAKALKAMGMTAGVPDLLILMGGTLHALELKSPSGRLTPSQRMTMERMRDCGAQVAIAKSVDEALVTLEVWGILRRNKGNVASESKSSSNAAGGESEQDLDATIRG